MSSFKDNDKRGNRLNYFKIICNQNNGKNHKGYLFHYIDVAINAISHLKKHMPVIIVLHRESNKTL